MINNNTQALLSVRNLKKYFKLNGSKSYVKANDGITLDIYKGETLGLVGESGCGKSTFGRVILQLYRQNEGSTLYFGRGLEEFKPQYIKVLSQDLKNYEELKHRRAELENDINLDVSPHMVSEHQKLKRECEDKDYALKSDGINLTRLTENEMRLLREDLQLIFQDPYSSLNPRMTAGQIIGEGLIAHNMYKRGSKALDDYVKEIMDKCGLANYMTNRYPHQFSGGQRQRIGIARALAVKPKFVVCDEAVSALDVSIQSQIINLLCDLKESDNLTYLFISHDLSVVKYISDRVGVMYLGNLVELAPTHDIYTKPLHPYTKALLSAIPTTNPETVYKPIILEGSVPSPVNPPSGCKFHTRCYMATEKCKLIPPEFTEAKKGHFTACHYYSKLL